VAPLLSFFWRRYFAFYRNSDFFFCERNELISLIKAVENSNLDTLYQARLPCRIKGFSNIKKYDAVDILSLKLRVTLSVL
jgi:hypothetical protein